ncbi:MAG: hypothetical protein IJM09_01875 [Neisseriaceae bacterium]|nr:hypothetical protein [Neisseriaceae bacterium]
MRSNLLVTENSNAKMFSGSLKVWIKTRGQQVAHPTPAYGLVGGFCCCFF